MKVIGKLMYLISLFIVIIIVLFFTILIVRALKHTKSTPALSLYHDSDRFKEEFNYSLYDKFEDYIEDEEKYINDLYEYLASNSLSDPKYIKGNVSYPLINGSNKNSSSLHYPDGVAKGCALVVHGLSDSPYHMLHIIKSLNEEGYIVLNLRLPGHGIAPGGLVNVRWKEWAQAVEFALNMCQKKLESTKDKRFITVGFSTGGAVLINYILNEIKDNGEKIPEKVILYSPAASISKQAFFADFHQYISWFPGLEKFKWMDILEEFDPYKFQSFPKNAAYQIYKLTEVNKRLAKMISKKKEWLDKVPPIITFQSPFDGTVEYKGIVNLYKNIGNRESKLILFKENSVYSSLYVKKVDLVVTPEAFNSDFRSNLFMIKNIEANKPYTGLFKVTVEKGEFNYSLLDDYKYMTWGDNEFALSHISPHINPLDEYYGRSSLIFKENDKLKGEHHMLKDESNSTRLKYNPFYSVTDKILKENI